MIGIFDSGLGGLTVLQPIQHLLPDYDYIYLGDSARAPYGSKSPEIIYTHTKQAIHFLFDKGCTLIIIACNTASAEALRKIQREYVPIHYPHKRVLGVIRPLVEKIAQDATIQRVGIIATQATVASNAYVTELAHLNPALKIYQQATPLLVPLIEEGWLDRPETTMILKKYLRPLKQRQVQTLIPACTHYPFLLKKIQRIMTHHCNVLNPGAIIAESLADYLTRHPELGVTHSPNQTTVFYTTDDIAKFKTLGEKFLRQPIRSIEKLLLS